MIGKLFILLFLLSVNSIFSQQIKVEYIYVRSPIATVKEKLYINGDKTFAIQDSIIHIQNIDNDGFSEKNTNFSPQIISFLESNKGRRRFIYIGTISDSNDILFSVADNNAHQEWKIDYNSSKKILNYKCFKAETTFRGRKFTAYFTKELSYQTGPYKFYGLPGLILELYTTNIPYYRWKATFIDLANKDNISYKPIYRNLNQVELKEFVEKKDQQRNSFFEKVNSKVQLPEGVTSEPIHERPDIEMVYEWENK